MAVDAKPPIGVAVALGVAQTIAWAFSYYLPAVLAGPVAEDLGAPRALILAAFSAALLLAGLAAPRVGRHIDLHGGRGMLAASALVIAAGLAALGALPGITGWFIGWLVLGLGMAMGLYDAAFATLGRLYGVQARRMITVVTLFAGFASTMGWPLGAVLLPVLGWRGLCLAYAALHVLLVLPVYLAFVPRAAPEPPPRAAQGVEDAAAAEARRRAQRRAFLLISAFFVLRSGISAVFSVHMIALLEGLGLTLAAAVAFASLTGAAQVGGRVLEFTLGARAHALLVARLGAALLPLGAFSLLLAGPVAALPFVVLYGASNGIFTISRGQLPLAIFGPQGYATLMGKLAMPVLLIQALTPTALAPMVDLLPAEASFAAAGVLSLLAFLCLLPLRVRS